jgi:hypothetical protein
LIKCLPPFIARQLLGKHVAAAEIHETIEELLDACVCGSMYPLSFLGNGSVKKFPLQERILGGVIFYVVHIVSKESKRLGLLRTFCFYYILRGKSTFFTPQFLSALRWAANASEHLRSSSRLHGASFLKTAVYTITALRALDMQK